MHEAAFELIEIPHVRQSEQKLGRYPHGGRCPGPLLHQIPPGHPSSSSAAIPIFRRCVSKLRENNKAVIGIGVKNSSSDLLIANCDEFIYYDDLVRKKKPRKKPARKPARQGAKGAIPEKEAEERIQDALDLIMETLEALAEERGSEDKIWGSMVKQTLKRRRPGFNESYYGFRSFKRLLEEAAARELMVLEPDEKSGGYIIKSFHQEDE